MDAYVQERETCLIYRNKEIILMQVYLYVQYKSLNGFWRNGKKGTLCIVMQITHRYCTSEDYNLINNKYIDNLINTLKQH